jgi:uncharacterized membrane protein YfcA
MTDIYGLAGLFVAGILAGATNSVAGGGTLISFPSLVAFGESQIVSNATNTAAMWPGSLSSAIGYRKDTPLQASLLATLLIPSFLGAILGAVILVSTPPGIFNMVVPFLVLFATLLFAFRDHITRTFRHSNSNEEYVSTGSRIWGFFFQLFVATYGGYFGAGIGILMLGSLSIMGLRDIHKMNAIKTPLATVINCTAFVLFAVRGLVAWDLALVVGLGAILGGYVGARSAKHVNTRLLQVFVVVIGLIVSAWLLLKVIH